MSPSPQLRVITAITQLSTRHVAQQSVTPANPPSPPSSSHSVITMHSLHYRHAFNPPSPSPCTHSAITIGACMVMSSHQHHLRFDFARSEAPKATSVVFVEDFKAEFGVIESAKAAALGEVTVCGIDSVHMHWCCACGDSSRRTSSL